MNTLVATAVSVLEARRKEENMEKVITSYWTQTPQDVHLLVLTVQGFRSADD